MFTIRWVRCEFRMAHSQHGWLTINMCRVKAYQKLVQVVFERLFQLSHFYWKAASILMSPSIISETTADNAVSTETTKMVESDDSVCHVYQSNLMDCVPSGTCLCVIAEQMYGLGIRYDFHLRLILCCWVCFVLQHLDHPSPRVACVDKEWITVHNPCPTTTGLLR